jgi:NDP-sugar pyrophosphorylase family protein
MGDAVLQGLAALGQPEPEQFAVITAYHLGAGKMLAQMLEKGSGTVVAATQTNRPWEYGILRINDAGEAVGVIEKPEKGTEPSNQKVLTVYLLSRQYAQILKSLPTTEYNFESALDQEMSARPVPVFTSAQGTLTLKYPWHLFEFQKTLFGQLTSHRASTAKIAPTAIIDETNGPVFIGEHVQIGHCSRVVGPCYLGDHVMIGDFSLVRGSSLEQHTHIGCFTEIARSIFAEDVHVHSGYIGDSVIGHHVRIGAGFVTANKRLDRRSVGVLVKNKVVDSGRSALGVMIGDGASIGIQVGTMPGKCVGRGVVVAPNSSVDTNLSVE